MATENHQSENLGCFLRPQSSILKLETRYCHCHCSCVSIVCLQRRLSFLPRLQNMGRSSCGSICAALFLSLSCTSTTIAFTARPDAAISSLNSGRSGATVNKNGLSAQAVESDATTEKAGQNESKSLFQFYLLEGGMCPYAGERSN